MDSTCRQLFYRNVSPSLQKRFCLFDSPAHAPIISVAVGSRFCAVVKALREDRKTCKTTNATVEAAKTINICFTFWRTYATPRAVKEVCCLYPAGFLSRQSSQTNPAGLRRLLKPSFFLQIALLAIFAAFFPGATLHAQTGSITGTVVDPSGAAIPGAQVKIINQATGDLTREATSDGAGNFRALNVPPATYKITVTAPGMQELDRNGVVLDQDQSLGLGQVALTLGQATQTVTVTTQHVSPQCG